MVCPEFYQEEQYTKLGPHLGGRPDLLFPIADIEPQSQLMPNAELRPIPSIWGHLAGRGANPPDNDFIDAALRDLLAG